MQSFSKYVVMVTLVVSQMAARMVFYDISLVDFSKWRLRFIYFSRRYETTEKSDTDALSNFNIKLYRVLSQCMYFSGQNLPQDS